MRKQKFYLYLNCAKYFKIDDKLNLFKLYKNYFVKNKEKQ